MRKFRDPDRSDAAPMLVARPLSRIAPAAAPPPRQHTGGVAAALAALLLLSPLQMIAPPALHTQAVQAKELASGSGSKVNKDPLSLLRLGLPGQPKEVRDLQAALESCQDNLSRLLFSKVSGAHSPEPSP